MLKKKDLKFFKFDSRTDNGIPHFFFKAIIQKIEIRATEFDGFIDGHEVNFWGDVYMEFPMRFEFDDGQERSIEIKSIGVTSKYLGNTSGYIYVEFLHNTETENVTNGSTEIKTFKMGAI